MPIKEASQTQPRPVVRRQPSPPSNTFVSKFSYEPRADESAYYQGLFNYVASFLKHNEKKNEIILPPKLVAEKLFLASKIPSEKLRVIWNMATAVKPAETDEGSSTGGGAEEADSSKPAGEGAISNSITSGADSHVSKSSSKTGGEGGRDSASCVSINSKGTLVVMTRPQFNTTIRLIQLFQNKTVALDAKLKTVDTSKLNSKGNGAFMQGKLVTFDEDGLLPAYFAGVTGVILAMPGSMEYKLNGDISLVSTKSNNAALNRRRTTESGTSNAPMSVVRRRSVTGEMQSKGSNEARMKQMESEILQLKTTVKSLQNELTQLKALLPKRTGHNNMNMTRTISHPAMALGAKNGVNASPDSGDVRKRNDKVAAAPIDILKASAIANLTTASEVARHAKESSANKTSIKNEKQDYTEDDSPNTGVESFWGQKEETSDSQYPVKLAPSLQNKLKDMGRQGKGRVVVREVASFDPKVPPNVSSNIPAMHPSAKKQIIRVQPKIHAAPQTRGPSQAPSADLRQSASTSGSNGSSDIIKKLRSTAGSNGQTSPGMISSAAGDFDSAVSNLRTSVGNTGQPSTGIKTPKEDFDSSLRSSASNSRQTSSAPKSILRGSKPSNPQPMRTDQQHQQQNFVPKRNDPSRLSLHSAATAPRSNALKNARPTNVANNPNKISPKVDDEPPTRRSSTKTSKRLTRDALTESIRHIVRNKDGSIQVYQEKNAPPSTNATDVQPLQPAPMTASSILQNIENGIKPKKKSGSVLMRRLSSG
jgi:hypothetical protein